MRRRRKVVFALVPVVVLLAAAEWASRAFFRDDALMEPFKPTIEHHPELQVAFPVWKADDTVPDPYGGYRLADPRDPASRRPPRLPGPPKAAGEVRVLCLGDSTTYGIKLPEKDAYPARLQGYLNAWAPPGVRFEVYNGGVPGYGPQQCKRLFQSRLAALNPDIVLWREEPEIPDVVGLPDPISERRIRLTRFLDRSRLIYLLTVGYRYLRDPQNGWSIMANLPVDHPEGYHAQVMPEFIGWCRDRGVAAFVGVEYLIYYPLYHGPATLGLSEGYPPDPRHPDLTGNLPRWRGRDLDCIPCAEGILASGEDPASLFLDFIHPNAQGYDLIARLVSADLRRRWPGIAEGLAARRGTGSR